MHENNLCGIGLCTSTKRACYIPLLHTNACITFPESQSILQDNEFLKKLKSEIFENEQVLKIGHNMKEHIKNLSPYNVQILNYDDVMVMSYVLYCGKFDHDMESLLKNVLFIPNPREILIPERDVLGIGKKKVTFANAPIVPLMQFVAQHADFPLRLYSVLSKELQMQTRQLEFYHNIEQPLVQTLADIELQGVCVDRAQLVEMEQENSHKQNELRQQILATTGMTEILPDEEDDGSGLNINSNRQLGNAIFDLLQIGREHAKKSKKSGDYVLDSETLDALAKDGHEIAKDILSYRAISKLQSTYIQGLQQHINTYTQHIHTTFQNALTVTGRLSSTSPNLQNIPIRTPAGKAIRKCFVAPPGHVILKVDYSQVELRILAHIANIGVLKQAFKENKDVHAITASQVFNVPLEGLEKDLRQKAKAINFGIIYGMSEFGLAKRIDVPTEKAKHFIELYFKQYPGIKQYMENTKEFCRKNGYVNTLFGRKCWIPDINSENSTKRGFAERTCINTPIQGTSADITKIAMNSIRRAFREHNIRTKMIIQVHDEIVFEAPEDEVDTVVPIIKRVMEGAADEFSKKKFSVPLTVDVSIGKRWTDD
jgi:DNA polymerase-1